eukprot:TRINITY_DN5326_c0_g1_i3.p1 TRINITY_DN5326_c0_g1~~TRINITY_DN5326_c0_g1_i3.p1  ORF type:complete len:135 (-),score=3.65 TRINITY_DN5326_c0_g1_i3:49-453(-)
MIHIDFGFMLWNSPGGLNFETAPFKLISEYVEVLGGPGSNMYHYFQALIIRGFMELRKYMDRIVMLVEMMAVGSKLPCFQGGPATITYLKDRFCAGLTDNGFIKFVEDLIFRSLDNWRTTQYDKFQYYTNNILY